MSIWTLKKSLIHKNVTNALFFDIIMIYFRACFTISQRISFWLTRIYCIH